MKINEIIVEQGILQIEKDDDKETTLVDPKTNVKTVVPKDPNKPGMIKTNDAGKLELDTKTSGKIERGIKPGDAVMVKQ
jgi:hypothetical protein